MRFVYKHISGRYIKFDNWSKTHVDDITKSSIFDDHDMVPPLPEYTYVSYEKELRKIKINNINSL